MHCQGSHSAESIRTDIRRLLLQSKQSSPHLSEEVVLHSRLNRLSCVYFASSDQRRLIRTDRQQQQQQQVLLLSKRRGSSDLQSPFLRLRQRQDETWAEITTSRQEKESSAVTKERTEELKG